MFRKCSFICFADFLIEQLEQEITSHENKEDSDLSESELEALKETLEETLGAQGVEIKLKRAKEANKAKKRIKTESVGSLSPGGVTKATVSFDHFEDIFQLYLPWTLECRFHPVNNNLKVYYLPTRGFWHNFGTVYVVA